jgi:hypothetical protein
LHSSSYTAISCPKLKKLKVTDNPLITIPPSILQKDTCALLDYLTALNSGGMENWTQVKLLILGKEGIFSLCSLSRGLLI